MIEELFRSSQFNLDSSDNPLTYTNPRTSFKGPLNKVDLWLQVKPCRFCRRFIDYAVNILGIAISEIVDLVTKDTQPSYTSQICQTHTLEELTGIQGFGDQLHSNLIHAAVQRIGRNVPAVPEQENDPEHDNEDDWIVHSVQIVRDGQLYEHDG